MMDCGSSTLELAIAREKKRWTENRRSEERAGALQTCCSLAMVYHRSDSTTSSADSKREAEKSWATRDNSAESPAEPARNSGQNPRADDDVDENSVAYDPTRFSDELRSNEGRYSENFEARHSSYEGKYSSSHEGRYGDNRSRNGRDESSRYSRNSRSRDDERYPRSREDRRENYRDKERLDSSRHSERSRYREGSRYERHEEGSRRSEGARYTERQRYPEEYNDETRYSEASRFQDDSRNSESSRYTESSRYRSSRNEDWYGREGAGRYGSTRYDDDSRYSGENSRHWRERDQEPDQDRELSPDNRGAAYVEPEAEKVQNMFQNDGSFLEMFKKMQEANKPPTLDGGETSDAAAAAASAAAATAAKDAQVAAEAAIGIPKRPAMSIVGKRRGGRVLPTGMVKKVKKEEEVEETPKDAWSLYIAEVRKYKEASCEEEGKTRPLVK